MSTANRIEGVPTNRAEIAEGASGEHLAASLLRLHRAAPRPGAGAVEIDGRRCLLYLWTEQEWEATPAPLRPDPARDGGQVVWFAGRGMEWLVPAEPPPTLPWE